MSLLASPTLLGVERIQNLESLVASARRARENHEPHVVILSGPSGIGKTRLIQELFGRLAEEYDPYRFWVPTMEGRDSNRPDNRIVPSRNDGVPSKHCGFAWVPIRCLPAPDGFGGPDSGSIIDAARLTRQLHIDRRLDRLRNRALIVLLVAVAVQGILSALGISGLGWVSPLLGLIGLFAVLWDSAEAIRGVRDARRLRKRQRQAGGDVGSEDPCEMIRKVTSKTALSVFVVDDAHFADEETLNVLGELLDSQKGQLFVVAKWATVEPEPLQGAGIEEWFAELGVTPLMVTVNPIDDASMGELVKKFAPTLQFGEVASVATFSGGNPGTALFVLGLDKIQRLLRDQSRALDSLDVELKSLPPSNDDLIRVEWAYFPSQVRRLLAIAAQVGRTVPTGRLKGVFAKYLNESVDPLIGTARSPYRWLEEIDALVDRFSQENLYRFASGQASQELLLSELEILRQEILVVLADLESTSQSSATLVGSVAHLGATNLKGSVGAASKESVEAALIAVRLLSRPSQAQTRLDHCNRILVWVDANGGASDDHHSIEVETRYFMAKALDNLDPPSATECRAVLERIIGPGDALYADFRLRVANDAQRRGDHESAMAIYRELVAGRSYEVGHDVRVSAMGNMAISANASGDVREALKLSKRATKLQRREYGAGDPQWLTGKTNIANYLYRLGKRRRAQRSLGRAIKRSEKRLGPSHPSCIRAEAVVLWIRSSEMTPRERAEKYADYVERAEPALGRYARAVIEAKRDLIGALIDLGQLESAQAMALDLARDCRIAFGEDSRPSKEIQQLLDEISAAWNEVPK